MLEFEQETGTPAKLKVIGIGGGGSNAVNTMIEARVEGVEFIVANTDCQHLDRCAAPIKIPLGAKLTKGLGAGADPTVGRQAALEDLDRLREILGGAEMVFVTTGMGGGTGTGAAPVVAQIAKEQNSLVVGVVTKPFEFEGVQRMQSAVEGIRELERHVDSLLVVPNQRLLAILDKPTGFRTAFKMADDVLRQAVQGIADIITCTGYINVDFADVRTIMADTGRAVMGIGIGRGEHRAQDAARKAIACPLLEDNSIAGATGVLLNIIAGREEVTMQEIDEASNIIRGETDHQAKIIFGCVVDERLGDQMAVAVIATGVARGHRETPYNTVEPVLPIRLGAGPARRRPLKPVLQAALFRPEPDDAGRELDIPTFLRRQAD